MPTTAEIKRMIKQGGVRIEGVVTTDFNAPVPDGAIVQYGKRQFFKCVYIKELHEPAR